MAIKKPKPATGKSGPKRTAKRNRSSNTRETSPDSLPSIRDFRALSQARALVLERYTAASVLINRQMQILSLFGPTEEFLSQPSGTFTADILHWVRPGIRSRLRVAIQAAIRQDRELTVPGLRRRGDTSGTISFTVQPVSVRSAADGLLLVVFRHGEDPAAADRPRRADAAEASLTRQLEEAEREARDFAVAIVETLREPLLVLDESHVVRSANTAFYRVFRLAPDQVLGRHVFEVGEREWNTAEFRRLLNEVRSESGGIENLEIRREFSGVGELAICVNARTILMAGQRVVLLALEDITHRVEAERIRIQVLQQLIGAEEKERHRLALELHDETGQHVTAFLLGLATLRETHAAQPESRALIDDLKARAEELARHLHGIALQLRPTALDDHGLERALTNYVEDLSLRHGLEIDLHAGKNAVRLPPHIETVLYRVTQEALTNVLRHARSTKASVVLSRKKKEVSLIIEDNGTGFETERFLREDDTDHLGLRGMRERVTLAGGTLTIESRPEAGTTLFARIPLPSEGDAHAQG